MRRLELPWASRFGQWFGCCLNFYITKNLTWIWRNILDLEDLEVEIPKVSPLFCCKKKTGWHSCGVLSFVDRINQVEVCKMMDAAEVDFCHRNWEHFFVSIFFLVSGIARKSWDCSSVFFFWRVFAIAGQYTCLWKPVRPICVLKSHVSAPFFATIQCFTQKQVDKNIYVYKTHTPFFFLGWVEIYIYIYIQTSDTHYISISIYFIQVLEWHLFPAKLRNGHPPLGLEANAAWDVLRLRETLGAGAQAGPWKDERWVGGWEKPSFTTSPKEKGKEGTLFFWGGIMSQGVRMCLFVFFW